MKLTKIGHCHGCGRDVFAGDELDERAQEMLAKGAFLLCDAWQANQLCDECDSRMPDDSREFFSLPNRRNA